MSLRRGRYAQVMLQTYRPSSDTGDVYGAAVANVSSQDSWQDRAMKGLGALGVVALASAFFSDEPKKRKELLGVGMVTLGASLIYLGTEKGE